MASRTLTSGFSCSLIGPFRHPGTRRSGHNMSKTPKLAQKEARGGRSGLRAADGGSVRSARSRRTGSGATVTANLVGLVIACVLAVFLVFALLFPEKF
jgi:K+-transporting ATPase KdpF subunit